MEALSLIFLIICGFSILDTAILVLVLLNLGIMELPRKFLKYERYLIYRKKYRITY